MEREIIRLCGTSVELFTLNTVIVGSGAAGYQAAVQLEALGQRDIAIVTEGMYVGASRNAGSDKQTYYKLSFSGGEPDSVQEMARDLFGGGCVDGDIALAEAASSPACFFHLCSLGVPFPVNRYGEYVGYRTDHDTRDRATSAGPLTSKLMTEALEQQAMRIGVPILDGYMVTAVLTDGERAAGLLAFNRQALGEDDRYALFRCRNIVYATGGPAGLYADTVYPKGHVGGHGPAFRAGVRGRNLTEWQYGLASTVPRWNVSGTYMQVLPRLLSVDEEGGEHEFLEEYCGDVGRALSLLFQKGYEWPFNCQKARDGSSLVDLLVYRETVLRGRRVFLDYRENPGRRASLDFSKLSAEARDYLSAAGACFGTPIERLRHMNMPALELYRGKGMDLSARRLPIALCAQHNNGGLALDMWWQSNLPGFYPVGEAAGSHGVRRPGGSALNAGQVGGLRAATHIAAHGSIAPMETDTFLALAEPALSEQLVLVRDCKGDTDNTADWLQRLRAEMSAIGGPIRRPDRIREAIAARQELLGRFTEEVTYTGDDGLLRLYRLWDATASQIVYLQAMADYAEAGGGSRGSALYTDETGEAPPDMPDDFRFRLDDGRRESEIQETVLGMDGSCRSEWRPVRPIPAGGGVFETVWREFREQKHRD